MATTANTKTIQLNTGETAMLKKPYHVLFNHFMFEIASQMPEFSIETLQFWTDNTDLKEITTEFCPVWSGLVRADPIKANTPDHFCRACQIEASDCPASQIDLKKLSFQTFVRGGDESLLGKARLERLKDSDKLALDTLQFHSLLKRHYEQIMAIIDKFGDSMKIIACDRLIYNFPDNGDQFVMAFPKPSSPTNITTVERLSIDKISDVICHSVVLTP